MDRDKFNSYLNSIIGVLTTKQLEQTEEAITNFRGGIDTYFNEFETLKSNNETLNTKISEVETELTNSKEKYYDLFKNGIATIQNADDEPEEIEKEEPVKSLSELLGE